MKHWFRSNAQWFRSPGVSAGTGAVVHAASGPCNLFRSSGRDGSMTHPAAAALCSSDLAPKSPGNRDLGAAPELRCRLRSSLAGLLLGALAILLPAIAPAAITVDNTAHGSYQVGALTLSAVSNTVSTVVRTRSTLEFLAYAPSAPGADALPVAPSSYLAEDKTFMPLSPPTPLGSTTPLDLNSPLPLVPTNVFHENESTFLRLTDADQNLDPTARETVLVTLTLANGETETLRLTETGPDTGIFSGYIQTATGMVTAGDGRISVSPNGIIVGRYTDAVDGSDSTTAAVLVDPFGLVFDSVTGLPVNGATVTVIDVATGQPAVVFGDDGISSFPASVVSGGTVQDSDGVVYTFTPGGYRFPYLLPGNYRLVVIPPAGYRAPSQVATTELQSLPGAPFAIAEPGSRGEPFVINPGPAVHIDLPIDPLRSLLYVTKTATKSVVALGDPLQYQVTVENTTPLPIADVVLNDRLPPGFRFHKGTTRVAGNLTTDPSISADGRTLTFSLGSIDAGATVTVSYLVDVGAGSRPGKAVNSASAIGSGGVTSNTATAEVLVRSEFFERKSFIMGRVHPQGCDDTDDHDGVAGVRIYLEDGSYVITDRQGLFHFEGINPGSHVVQLDLTTLPKDFELASCEENDRFAGTPYSQFVDLQPGGLWRVDFYTKPKLQAPAPEALPTPGTSTSSTAVPTEMTGSVGIELSSALVKAKGPVEYTIILNVGAIPLANQRLTVSLAEGASFIPGSSTLDGTALADPDQDGNTLTYQLGDVPAGWQGQVKFKASIALLEFDSDLITRAILTFDTATTKDRSTPEVENQLHRSYVVEKNPTPLITLRPLFDEFGDQLAAEDLASLDDIIAFLKRAKLVHITVIGHTNATRIAPRSRHIYADNYALSRGRAKAVADYLAAGLDLDPQQITVSGKGPDQPVASNRTERGRALNRRVELRIETEETIGWSDLKNIKNRSGQQKAEVREIEPESPAAVPLPVLPALEAPPTMQLQTADAQAMPEFNLAWVDKATPGLSFVWPQEDYFPPLPSVKIAVKHDARNKLKLFLNSTEVDPVYLDGTVKGTFNQVALTTWYGVHLQDGANLFEAVEIDGTGREVQRLKRNMHFSGLPVRAEVLPALSQLTANGKTPPVIALRLTDKDGQPARSGVVSEFSVAPPYLPQQLADELQVAPLARSKSTHIKFTIGADGIARIALQPTVRTGEALLTLHLANGDKEIRAWLSPAERDWIIVGFAEGSAGYNTLAGNMESLTGSGGEDNYYDNSRLAFFAKGMIQGKWLLTMAYDSDKPGIRGNRSLHGTIDPDSYYTLYGDATTQQYEAASARSLFLKIERGQFYALFGDFTTGLTVTELSRYNRNLNGFKSELKGEHLDFNIFVSDTNQAFVKDELRGDGSSGLYRLSRDHLMINSESVTIETRDRFRSEVILSAQPLNRHIDYDIDYERGTLYFRTPVFSRDENFNPIYIVVDYESADSSDLSFNYGGRSVVRFAENRVEIGASHVHEGRVGGEGNLEGIDVRVKLSEETTARAEIAATQTDFNHVDASGHAYLAEVSHQSAQLSGRAYLREQDDDFGLGQQSGSEAGTRKLGLDGSYNLSERLSVSSQAFRQENLSTDAVRHMADGQLNWNTQRYALHGGLRYAQDRFDDGQLESSTQLTAGGSYNLLGERLVARIQHDQSLFSSDDNSDYPTRTTLGLDYRLNEDSALFVAQEFTRGAHTGSESTRIGFKSSPWNGGQLSTSLEQQKSENGTRVFSVTGLRQGWQLSKAWSIDAGLERNETLRESTPRTLNTNVPPASGGNDFTAISTGAAYQAEKWLWNGRLELRTSSTEDKYAVQTGVYGEVRPGLGLSALVQASKIDALRTADSVSSNLRLGLAFRPKLSKWTIFDRFDYITERQQGTALGYDNWRLVNNLHVNWKPNHQSQLTLQYAAKYVQETISAETYGGYTDLLGLEGRYDLTPRWDIGLRGNALHSWDNGQILYGTGVSVGYNVVKNAWLSVGYNIFGFEDRDFSAADFTAQGPFIKMRLKFDQGSLRDAVRWVSGS